MPNRIDPIAIYGAVLSTIVLVWNIFVWLRTGPRLKVSASANMKTFPRGADDSTFIAANVSNIGTQPTTITHVVAFAYRNRWNRFRRKHHGQPFVVLRPAVAAYPLPYVLPAGGTFMSKTLQTKEIEKISREKLLYVGVIHSSGKRPVLARVQPIEDPERTS